MYEKQKYIRVKRGRKFRYINMLMVAKSSYNGPYRKRIKKERICRKSEVKRLSEAKNKMSIIERIRSRIGESALYGGKTVCDSPCRFISLTKTRQALRLAFGTICAQIVAANLLKNVQFILSHPEEAESRREDLGTSVPFMERLITALACGDAHALRAQHDNAWKIITATEFMNITFNGGYHA